MAESKNPNYSEALSQFCIDAGLCPPRDRASIAGSDHDPRRERNRRRRNRMLLQTYSRLIVEGYDGDMSAACLRALGNLEEAIQELE